jgi:predicted glycogen debranching enzyme
VIAVEAPRRLGWRRGEPTDALLAREWLLANGLGGYAFGTLAGVPTRRYHGLLIAALAAPHGRTVTVDHLHETLIPAGGPLHLSGLDGPSDGAIHLEEVALENGRPVWTFRRGDVVLEKRIVLTYRQNTARVSYRLVTAGAPARLIVEPTFALRPHDARVDGEPAGPRHVERRDGGFEVRATDPALPPVRVLLRGPRGPATGRLDERGRTVEIGYRIERARGYEWRGRLRSLGALELELRPGEEAFFAASTEDWPGLAELGGAEARLLDDERRLVLASQASPALRDGVGRELVLAADQFIVTPRVRPTDEARLAAEGDEARTVIAGYPWFTDWGRDTMISLEGLTLLTGRHGEARSILHTFARHVRDGLIPNLFPEGQTEGLYHTADATLWFFHALDRYERATGDAATRRNLLPTLVEIARKHLVGTRFGIGVDPDDGLLRQGAPGYQLTWMDAKVGDWVVTPRRGKAVEINALFYNALVLLAGWLEEESADKGPVAPSGAPLALAPREVHDHAARLRASFNRRFWNPATGCLFDVVDGEPDATGARDDASIRPNQVLAISLPHPVLERERWPDVMGVVRERLATPFGLRSLAPGHPDYKPRYDGDLRARDAAYHQGTIWGWLLGPFVDAWLKTFPGDRAEPRRLLAGLEQELSAAAIGTISEIYDAEPPFVPRGCVAQAWSVAEALRAIVATS